MKGFRDIVVLFSSKLSPAELYQNGDSSSEGSNFLSDEIDCKSDCIYKEHSPEAAVTNGGDHHVIFGKTDLRNGKDQRLSAVTNGFESICLKTNDIPRGDINHNGGTQDDVDSDTECTEPSETTIVCDAGKVIVRSVETSTETLTSENVVCG